MSVSDAVFDTASDADGQDHQKLAISVFHREILASLLVRSKELHAYRLTDGNNVLALLGAVGASLEM